VQRRELAQALRTAHRDLATTLRFDERAVPMCRTPHLTLLFGVEKLAGCPEDELHGQLHLFADRLEALHAQLAVVLALDATAPAEPLRVALLSDERTARRVARTWCGGVEMQGLGTIDVERGVAVLSATRAHGTDAALHGVLAHVLARLVLGRLVTPRQRDELGYGFLDAGLAHWCEMRCAGRAENFCVLDRLERPREYHGGDSGRAARGLLDRTALPSLERLLVTGCSDFDFADHAPRSRWSST